MNCTDEKRDDQNKNFKSKINSLREFERRIRTWLNVHIPRNVPRFSKTVTGAIFGTEKDYDKKKKKPKKKETN